MGRPGITILTLLLAGGAAAGFYVVRSNARKPAVDATRYGLDSWDKIEALRYTWHLQLGKIDVSRSREWEPKTGKVTYEGKDKDGKPVKVTYMHSELASQPDSVKNDIEPAFVNDNYTFLFPLKAYWDTTPSVTDQGTINLPLGSGSAELLAVKYPAEVGGYTPGVTLGNSTLAKTTGSSFLITTAAVLRCRAFAS